MHIDAHGLPLTIASAEAARAWDHAMAGYVGYRADAADRIKAVLVLDPGFTLAHVLRGCFAVMSFSAANLGHARDCLAKAEAAARAATPREQAHVAALARWAGGDVPGALGAWEAILRDHPADTLAFRMHHFAAFWIGDARRMAETAEAIAPAWTADMPHYASLLACRAFAREESGDPRGAEALGREAVARDPADMWAAHAVAHCLEMQGRGDDGIAYLKALTPNWDGGNNLKHHLFWHQALFHLDRGDTDQVLQLYDHGFRDLGSPLTQAMPDLYIDVQNAAAMLFRLKLCGVDAGARWTELADHAEARIGDVQSAFTLPHWTLALVNTGRFDAARRQVAAIDAAADGSHHGSILRHAALPACQAVLHHAQGDHEAALAALAPAAPHLPRLGGSHAQQALFTLLADDAAAKAGTPPLALPSRGAYRAARA
jgi:hypothetical protein